MISKRQIGANRRNARKSTGPKSEEGKEIAKFNALRHGLTAEEIVIPGEDKQAFCDLRDQLVTELNPEGVLETQLVERVAVSFWRLRRTSKMEAGTLARRFYLTEYAIARNEEIELISGDDGSDEMEMTVVADPKRYETAKAKAEEMDILLSGDLSTLGRTFLEDVKDTDTLGKLSRYETAIERSLYRALHELQRLQAARKGGVAAPIAVDLTIDSG